MATYSESPLARKIRALMAKAKDPSVTEAEALAYSAKVQELLAKNNMSLSDVKQDEDVERGEVGRQDFAERWKSPARKHLLRAVCRFYMCEAISPGRKGGVWSIIGRPHNVIVAVEITDYLIATTVRLSNAYGRAHPGSNIIDFRRGCMARLAERLNEMRVEQTRQKQEWRAPGNPGNLPALFVSERKQVEVFMKDKMQIRWGKSKPIKQATDAQRGRAAADGISLSPQVGGATKGGRLLLK